MTLRLLTIALLALVATGCGSSGPSVDGEAPDAPQSGPGPTTPVPVANRAPVANDDKIVAGSAGAVDIFVLQNDSDADGDALAIIELGVPTAGGAVLMDNGTTAIGDDFVRYTPPAGFAGSAMFSYVVADSASATSRGFVTVQSDASVDDQPNAAPFARPDAAETSPGSSVLIDVLANDTDADGDTLFLLSAGAAAHGQVEVDGRGTPQDASDDRLRYTPAPGFSGNDSLRYEVSDGRSIVAADVTVSVQAITVLPPAQACGIVMIGPLVDARIALFDVDAAGNADGDAIAETTTDGNGQWCLTLPGTRGDLLVVADGGSYFDPADSGNASDGLRNIDLASAVLETVLFADADFAMTTPFTSALLRKSRRESAGDDFAAVLAANRASATAAFVLDPFVARAGNPLNPAGLDATGRAYSMITGGAASALNRLAVDLSLPAPSAGVVDAFVRDYSDCALDGAEAGVTIEVDVDGVLRALPTGLDLNLEILRFRNNLFDVYAGVPLARIAEADCAVSGEQPDTVAPVFALLPADTTVVASGPSGIALDDAQVQAFLATAVAVDNRAAPPVVVARLAGGGALPTTLALGDTPIVWVASDEAGNSTTSAARTLTVSAVPPPVANDDVAAGDEDTTVTIDILANDMPGGNAIDPSSVAVLGQTAGGSVAIDPATGAATVTPPADFFGEFTFTYTVADLSGLTSGPALVTVTFTAMVEDPPVATDDSFQALPDTPLRVRVLDNDGDPDPDGLDGASVVLVDPPANGTAVVVDGEILYTPDPGFTGTDSLTYRVVDAQGNTSNLATIVIEMSGSGSPPVAADASLTVAEDDVVLATLTATDADGSVDPATFLITVGATHGSVTLGDGGLVRYEPQDDYSGADSFRFVVADDDGFVSNEGLVSVTVTPVPDDPVAFADSASTSEDTPVRVAVLANDVDPDGDLDAASVEIVVSPANGAAVVEVDGDVSYTPAADFSGVDSLSYRVADGRGVYSAPAVLTLDVVPVDDPPVAADDTYVTLQDTGLVLDVLSNDSDPDGAIDPTTVTLTGAPLGTAVVDTVTGRVDYTPPAGFVGEDSFGYRVADLGGNESGVATVTVVAWPADDPDFDGVGNVLEAALGTDPNAADDAYVFVDPAAAPAASDGNSWATAFPDLAAAAAAGRLQATPGRTTWVVMADNSAGPISGTDWTLDLDGSCDDMVFVGGLGYLVTEPRKDADGLPVTRLDATATGARAATVKDCDDVILHSLTLRGGSGVADGGGLLLRSSIVRLIDVLVEDNVATTRGGGIAVLDSGGSPDAELSIENSLLRDNAVVTEGGVGRGGAVYADDDTVVSLTDSRLIGNRIDQQSGTPVSGGGAGLFAEDAEVKISGSTLSGNVSNSVGGALALRGSSLPVSVMDSILSGNEGGQRGGAVYLSDTDANVVLHNNLILSNHAIRGGGIYARDAEDTRISNATAMFNHAVDGGGCLVTDSSPVFNDNILQFNVADNSGANIGGNIALLASLNASNNFVDNSLAGFVGVNNTDADPQFDVGFYLSHPASPAIDFSLSFDSSDPFIELDGYYTDAAGGTTDVAALDTGYHYATPAVAGVDEIEPSALEFGLDGVNQRVRLRPKSGGTPIGPGRRIYVEPASPSISLHLFEQTAWVRDPRGGGGSTEARDLGNGYYEVLADSDDSGTYEFDVWVDSLSGPPQFRITIIVN